MLATAPDLRLVGLGPAGLVGDAEAARLVRGHEQRQFLRLRLLPRLVTRQRRRCCSPLRRRRLPLRRSRDAQRRLLGGGGAVHVHHLATAPHLRLVGLGLAGVVTEAHAEVARAVVVGHAQHQPLRLRLLPRLLARQRDRLRCSLLRRRLPLRRSSDAQCRRLGGGEAAQVHHLVTTPHLRLVGLRIAGVDEVHAEVARTVLGLEQRHRQLLWSRWLPQEIANAARQTD
eukprot:scaffold53974_cov59-Phaeocystis_antarctica.AAC.2